MSNTTKIWITLAVIIAIAVGAWFYLVPSRPNPLPVDPADHLSSWTIPVHVDATSTANLDANIALLQSYVGTTTYSAADIYVGIGNDYATLGNGKSAYQYYVKAIEATSTEVVAYENLGAIFAELHATSTALEAYAKAVALSPSTEFYQLAYLDTLASVEPRSPSTAAAFSAAEHALGLTPDYLITRAEWEGAIGSTTAAIDDWEIVRSQVDPAQQAAVDAQIARLKQ